MKLNLERSERIYTALLSLYPVHFRARFGGEMMQVFRDCSRDTLEKNDASILFAFWMSVVRDLLFSAIRERRRELLMPLDADHPLTGVVDVLLIPSMVSANLLALGPILALLVTAGAGGPEINSDHFFVMSGFFSFAVGSLAVVTSLVFTKLRPTVRLWVKLK